MDALCLKAGIHGMAPPLAVGGNGVLDVRMNHPSQFSAAGPAEKPSISAAPQRNLQWGSTFRYPLRSLWPGGKNLHEPAIAVDDAILVEEKEETKKESQEQNGNWVLKILQSRRKEEDERDGKYVEEMGFKLEHEHNNGGRNLNDEDKGECCNENGDCDLCIVDDDDDDDDDEKKGFDRESFSKLLRKVPLSEARLYAQMSYLGCLAYSISQIKPMNLLRSHGIRYVISSLEKREQSLKAEKEMSSVEDQHKEEKTDAETRDEEGSVTELAEGGEEKSNEKQIYASVASSASYLHSHTKSILRFKTSKSKPNENFLEENQDGIKGVHMINQDVASLMVTTDSVTAVVAAKEEVKQAVADDLKSISASPCEWFVCDDDKRATRFFVIQGSESLASWQANLLFEPAQFEGLDVLVHRGIYEAAKGTYEKMLPEIREHLKSHGDRAKFQFTGHSLGGSLSLLVNLMLLIRGEAPVSSLLPVITFGAPSIMCGGDSLLRDLGLSQSHVRAITMHRDIVPRAFSCNYPNHVAEFLKAVNGNFRNLPCLSNQKLLYAPMGEFLILQPDEKFSPSHDLLPSGSGFYLLRGSGSDVDSAKLIQAAQAVFLNSPHPLEILSDRSAYGSEGTIQRDHDISSYLKSVRNVIRQDLNRIRKARREHRRKFWWPLVAPRGVNAGIVLTRPVASGSKNRGQFNFSGIAHTGRETLKRFSTLVASQHMHLLVVMLFPARLLVLGAYSSINFH